MKVWCETLKAYYHGRIEFGTCTWTCISWKRKLSMVGRGTVHSLVSHQTPKRRESGKLARVMLCRACMLWARTYSIQDTSKCYVGRNGKQKLHIQVCGSLKTQRNRDCQVLNVHTNQILARTFSHGTLDSVVS